MPLAAVHRHYMVRMILHKSPRLTRQRSVRRLQRVVAPRLLEMREQFAKAANKCCCPRLSNGDGQAGQRRFCCLGTVPPFKLQGSSRQPCGPCFCNRSWDRLCVPAAAPRSTQGAPIPARCTIDKAASSTLSHIHLPTPRTTAALRARVRVGPAVGAHVDPIPRGPVQRPVMQRLTR